MTTFVIGYDLMRPGQDYKDLFDAIKAYGTWCHPLDSTWFIVSDASPVQIRDNLATKIDKTDRLFVGVVESPAAWRGFSDEVTAWLQRHL